MATSRNVPTIYTRADGTYFSSVAVVTKSQGGKIFVGGVQVAGASTMTMINIPVFSDGTRYDVSGAVLDTDGTILMVEADERKEA